MWLFLIGCATLLIFQNAKTQGVYEFPGRFNSNRRSYAIHPSHPAYEVIYPSNIAHGRVYPNTVGRGVYPSAVEEGSRGSVSNGGVHHNGVAHGRNNQGSVYNGFYPNYNIRRVMHPHNDLMYPNSISSGTVRGAYPNIAVMGWPHLNNVGRGASYPVNGIIGTPNQSNRRNEVVNSNVATGAVYPHNSAAGTSFQTNRETGIANTGVTHLNNGASGTLYQTNNGTGSEYPSNGGLVRPNVINAGSTYPHPGSNTVISTSPSPVGSTASPSLVRSTASPNIFGSTTESVIGSTSTNLNITGGMYPISGGIQVFTSASVRKQKVYLDVYYETNCPDSKRFITEQLTPTYRDLKDILEVNLIPFGKAEAFFDDNSKQYHFQCQHGPPECYGNTVQGCSMSAYPDVETHLNFIDCMMSYPRPSDYGQRCARRLSLNWNPISKCADGEEGKRILFRNGEKTKSLQPPVNFVPWININRVHSNSIQRRSLQDLKSVVCEAYKARHSKC